MKYIWAFVKFLIPLLPILLAAFLPWAINLKKENRYKQLWLPVIALLYGVIFLLLMDDISEWLLSGIYYILAQLQDFINEHEAFQFLNTINWTYGVMYIVNAVMLLLFVVIKSISLPICKAINPEKGKINKFLTELFYTYDETDKKWYIQNKFAHAKKVMKSVHIGVIIFSCLLFSVTCYFISKHMLSVPFYPVFGILIFGECFFFLSGIPKGGEEEPDIEAPAPEEPDEEIDYSTLKEIYEKLFPEKLSGSAELPPTSDRRSTVEQLLERYREEAIETDSQDAKLFHKYFSQLAKHDDGLDDGFIAAARNIMDGKNVLFSTPFYHDTTKYIFLPVLRHLMQNKKLLIIVGRTGADKGLIEWLKKGLFTINNFENLWKIDYISEVNDDTKIAILPMKDVYNQKLIAQKAEFLADTSMVIITDPTKLLGTMQMGLSNVVSYLHRGISPQYIAYDRNCDGLVDSLSHVLNSSIEEVAATVVGTAPSTAMVWEADALGLHNRLGLDTARYLGVGTEMGTVALKNKVSKVNWYSYEKFPATDIRWIVSQYYGPLCKIMGIPVSQAELEEKLAISGDIWSMPKGDNRFIIAEDEYNNPYEMIRQFSTRANKQSFIHVLSQNYLLRDYMCGNAEIFTFDPKAIPNLVADYQRVRSNTVYRIAMRLINGEIYEEEIKEALALIGIETEDVYEEMVSLITKFFIPEGSDEKMYADGIISVRYELLVDPRTRRPQRKRIYSITNELFIEKFLSQLQVVHYVAEDESNKNLYMNSILYGHIYQKYLPGTFAVFDSKYYEVVSITPHSGMIVRRAADHLTKRKYNRQLRTYDISDFAFNNEHTTTVTYGNIQLEYGEAKINVSTSGYLELNDYGDMKNATKVSISGVPDRSYPHKNIIRFKLNGSDAKIRFTIATLMNELFITLFPDMHEYIVATTKVDADSAYEGYIPFVTTDDEADDYIYVIEDSLIDMGLLINVERYFTRIMEIITDLLSWHDEEYAKSVREAEEGDDEGEIPADDDGEDEGADGEGEEKKKSWWRRFIDWIKRFFGSIFKRKKKDDAEQPEGEGEPEGGDGASTGGDENAPEGGNGADGDINTPADGEGDAPADGDTADGGSTSDGDSANEPSDDKPDEGGSTADAPADGDSYGEPIGETPADDEAAYGEPVDEAEAPAEGENPEAPAEGENAAEGESTEAPAEGETPAEAPAEPEEGKKKGGFGGWIKGLFGGKKKKDKKKKKSAEDLISEASDAADAISDGTESNPNDSNTDSNSESQETATPVSNMKSFSFTHKDYRNNRMTLDIIDDNEEGITGEDEESVVVDADEAGSDSSSSGEKERKPYHERFYMLYGYDAVPEALDLEGTYNYLKENGFDDNYLKHTRENAANTKRKWYNTRFEPGVHYCDFCGAKLEGKISVLKDGRERCKECEATAITKVKEFRKLYRTVHARMEAVFGIKIKSKIQIKITNAKEIAAECGYEFEATPGYDGRALGFAQPLGNGKTRIYLENGSPRLETEKTLVHELTHIWQFENMDCLWNPKDLVAIEGMSVWVEAQYLICNGEAERAQAYVASRMTENSEYGQGMREYVNKFPFTNGKTAKRNTPFSYPGRNPLK